MLLIVEPDPRAAALIRDELERAGHRTVTASTARRALQLTDATSPDLVVLDLRAPDGLALCRRLAPHRPVVVLSARDPIAALEAGADDVLGSSFVPRELALRIRAVLRRAATPAEAVHTLGTITLAPAAREVRREGVEITLTAKEYELLLFLALHANTVVTRDELLASVWGFRAPGASRTVDVHVAQLRRRLGAPELIRTVRGIGYKLVV